MKINHDTKKIIANYMIKRIIVCEGNKLDIELDINVQQFVDALKNSENERAGSQRNALANQRATIRV